MDEQDIRALITGNPTALAHAVVGDAWSQLILREAFYGVRRFTDWHSHLGVPRSVLSQRLERLQTIGIFKTFVPEGKKRAEYILTPMGLDLIGVALMQGQWEHKHAPTPMQRRYSLQFYDAKTGSQIEPVVLDSAGGEPIASDNVDYRPGSGLITRDPPPQRRLSGPRASTERPIIERSVEIIGDYWAWSIVGCAFFRMRRFDEMLEATGMAPNILSDRLNRLTEQGIFHRDQYHANRLRYDYRLTKAGLDLHPIVMAMHGWSERWLCNFDNPPLMLVARDSGRRITPVVCAQETGKPVSAKRLRWRLEAPSRGKSRTVFNTA